MVKWQISVVTAKQRLNMYYKYAAEILIKAFHLIDGMACFSATEDTAN